MSYDSISQKPSVALDPRIARRLITRFRRFPPQIGVMAAVSQTTDALGGTPCRCQPFFQGADGLKIASDDPGTPVAIKRKLEEIPALCEDAGMVAGARDRASALPYWLVLLYNYNPQYFKFISEDTFWMRNLAPASIEYCEQYAFKEPGRPKSRPAFEEKTSAGETLQTFRRAHSLTQAEVAEMLGLSRQTIQRREYDWPWSDNELKNLRAAAQSRINHPDVSKKDKVLLQKLLAQLSLNPRTD
jgi:DNA-binding XRE family transcriptional regulator